MVINDSPKMISKHISFSSNHLFPNSRFKVTNKFILLKKAQSVKLRDESELLNIMFKFFDRLLESYCIEQIWLGKIFLALIVEQMS